MSNQRLEVVEKTLTTSLVNWSVASVVIGTSIALTGHKFGHTHLASFGRQTAAWGAVDAAIAGAGYASQRRRGALSGEATYKQMRKLRKILLINAVADVGYIAGGIEIVKRHRKGKSSLRMGPGDGIAVVVQGVFLLVLDVSQALHLRNIPYGSL